MFAETWFPQKKLAMSRGGKGCVCGSDIRHSEGRPLEHGTEMRQTYANAKKILHEFGATLDDVVEEVRYVTDMETAFGVDGSVRKEAYRSKKPSVAITILVTPRLALPTPCSCWEHLLCKPPRRLQRKRRWLRARAIPALES
jgi:hypothetical protein